MLVTFAMVVFIGRVVIFGKLMLDLVERSASVRLPRTRHNGTSIEYEMTFRTFGC